VSDDEESDYEEKNARNKPPKSEDENVRARAHIFFCHFRREARALCANRGSLQKN